MGLLVSIAIIVYIINRIRKINDNWKELERQKNTKRVKQQSYIDEVVNEWDYLFEQSKRKGRK